MDNEADELIALRQAALSSLLGKKRSVVMTKVDEPDEDLNALRLAALMTRKQNQQITVISKPAVLQPPPPRMVNHFNTYHVSRKPSKNLINLTPDTSFSKPETKSNKIPNRQVKQISANESTEPEKKVANKFKRFEDDSSSEEEDILLEYKSEDLSDKDSDLASEKSFSSADKALSDDEVNSLAKDDDIPTDLEDENEEEDDVIAAIDKALNERDENNKTNDQQENTLTVKQPQEKVVFEKKAHENVIRKPNHIETKTITNNTIRQRISQDKLPQKPKENKLLKNTVQRKRYTESDLESVKSSDLSFLSSEEDSDDEADKNDFKDQNHRRYEKKPNVDVRKKTSIVEKSYDRENTIKRVNQGSDLRSKLKPRKIVKSVDARESSRQEESAKKVHIDEPADKPIGKSRLKDPPNLKSKGSRRIIISSSKGKRTAELETNSSESKRNSDTIEPKSNEDGKKRRYSKITFDENPKRKTVVKTMIKKEKRSKNYPEPKKERRSKKTVLLKEPIIRRISEEDSSSEETSSSSESEEGEFESDEDLGDRPRDKLIKNNEKQDREERLDQRRFIKKLSRSAKEPKIIYDAKRSHKEDEDVAKRPKPIHSRLGHHRTEENKDEHSVFSRLHRKSKTDKGEKNISRTIKTKQTQSNITREKVDVERKLNKKKAKGRNVSVKLSHREEHRKRGRKNDNDDVLEERIKLIKKKNAVILKRQQEIEFEKKKYG